MGFVIQWVVYLVAFVGGSAIAYGIVALRNKTSARESAAAESGSVEPEPERVGLVSEPVTQVGSDSRTPEAGSETELSQPQSPELPAQWPGDESVSVVSASSSAEPVLAMVEPQPETVDAEAASVELEPVTVESEVEPLEPEPEPLEPEPVVV